MVRKRLSDEILFHQELHIRTQPRIRVRHGGHQIFEHLFEEDAAYRRSHLVSQFGEHRFPLAIEFWVTAWHQKENGGLLLRVRVGDVAPELIMSERGVLFKRTLLHFVREFCAVYAIELCTMRRITLTRPEATLRKLHLHVESWAARAYLHAAWGEYDAAVSPDGQWTAFTSLESGTPEIQVRRFPIADAGGRWKVSTRSGQRARWSGDGRTVYYQTADNAEIRAVRVAPAASFAVGPSETLMKVPGMGVGWDVDRTTGRIVATEPVVAASVRIVVMQHWLDQFRRGPGAR